MSDSVPYQRQPGDYEIRFLKDGRVVFVGPDQRLLDLSQSLNSRERKGNDGSNVRPDSRPPAIGVGDDE